ncbi:MAG: hypothetical protein DLM54_03435 [Acidimicrobiales bacterium]|nr:MAG: hypothetical protein DLM54_03435 [Acidimicrobiales bacterium]
MACARTLVVEGASDAVAAFAAELRVGDYSPRVSDGGLTCRLPGPVEADAWREAALRRELSPCRRPAPAQTKKAHPKTASRAKNDTPVLVEARRLVAAGHRVVELYGVGVGGSCTCKRRGGCRPGKHPVARAWSRGSDTGRIRPVSNLGVVLEGLLVVDLDGPGAETVLAQLTETHGLLPGGYAEARSGRPEGGRHLYFRIPTGHKAVAVAGLDILAGPSHMAVVAPSTHESGTAYHWVRPLGRVEELPWAPAWLLAPIEVEAEAEAEPEAEPASEPWAGDGTGMLQRAMQEVAAAPRDGHRRNSTLHRWAYTLAGTSGQGPGRAEVEAALLDAARRCGLVEEDGVRQCRASIHSGWSAGVQRPLLAPVRVPDPADIETLARVRATMSRRVWAGASGAVDLRVLDALVALGEGLARVEVRRSQRQVAFTCSIQRRTVGRAIHRLEQAGWLAIVEVGVGRLGSTYLLSCPAPDQGEDIYDPVVLKGGRQDPEPAVPRAHDVWIGLPASAPIVLGVLSRGPVRTPALAAVLGVSDRQAQRVLHSLAQVGLTVPDQGRWRLSDPAESDMVTALDAAAETLGTVGAMDRMRARHQEERVRYRAWWDGREECRRRRHRSAARYRPCREPVPQSAPTSLIGSRGPP